MKLSIEWLKRYCPNALKVHDVAGLLTSAGLEVEAIDEAPGGDFVLDAEVTSNRPDWLSHLGVARDLAVLGAGEFT
ncbi:MAG: phenylalanine--tRNA ligase subunit beta, partial [Candidatus Abyssubacteria bacterium]|nr:phenylalanine--tRNA ligase subunit beta [Candidatus Abyssubacteria bacterium]